MKKWFQNLGYKMQAFMYGRYTGFVDVLAGKEITVEFDRPTPLQIDGETVKNITSYCAKTSSSAHLED